MDATAWDARYADSELVWGAAPNRFVERECAGLSPGVALDLACGEGRNALWLARQGWHAHGFDYSRVAIERARSLAELEHNAVGRADFRVLDVTEVDRFHDDLVDLVVMAYVHVPAEQRQHLIAAAARGLTSGGHLLIVGHDLRNLDEGVSGPQDPSLLYVPEQLVADARATRPYAQVVTCGTEQRPTDAGVALDTVVHLTV